MILITHNILWSKYKGGVFTALHGLARKKGIHIDFVQIAETEGNRIALGSIDLSYHHYPYKLLFEGSYDDIPKSKLMMKLFLEVWRSKSKIVLIAGYHLPEYWLMLIAARLKGIKIGVFCDSTSYDNSNTFIKFFLKRIFFSQCDVFFGYGERSRDYLIKHGVNKENIFFRCQSAALPHDYDHTSVLEKRRFSKSNSSIRFLYVGRLSKEKNIDDILHAFSSFILTHPSSELTIVGGGPLDKYLLNLTTDLGLNNAVKFTGPKNNKELMQEYLNADFLILPSSSEPWGLVVNEALSYGCPVIVSNRCGCVPELVIEGYSGFVFECGKVDDLVKQMINATQAFVDKESTSKNCLNLINQFTPERAANQIFEGCMITLEK